MDREKLYKKWLSNTLSASEQEAFRQLDDYDLDLEILDAAKLFKASQFSTVADYSEIKKKLTSKKRGVIKLNSYKWIYRVAALLAVGLLGYYSFFTSNLVTVETLASEQSTFELPDASSVTLNAKSTIVYNKKKWENNRALTLTGEAYFKVSKGATFDVNTSEGNVQVIGTQFSVKQRDSYFEVICFEGKVNVIVKDKSHQLTQGKSYRFLHGKETFTSTENESPDWINNITNFRSVPLEEVLNELERQYNISVIRTDIDTNIIFTGGFTHTNLEQALLSISVPLNFEYHKESSNKIIFSKKK